MNDAKYLLRLVGCIALLLCGPSAGQADTLGGLLKVLFTLGTTVGEMASPTTRGTTGSTWKNAEEERQDQWAAHRKALAYGTLNADNLRTDMARGEGEYLTAFATLLNVPQKRHDEVFKVAQKVYPSVWRSGIPTEQSIHEFMVQLAADDILAYRPPPLPD
jgi:hypothetical protein